MHNLVGTCLVAFNLASKTMAAKLSGSSSFRVHWSKRNTPMPVYKFIELFRDCNSNPNNENFLKFCNIFIVTSLGHTLETTQY